VGIVDIAFQSAGTGKYATPTRHLNFHFAPLAVSYELFPTEKSKTIGFLLNRISILQFTSKKVLVSYFRRKSS